MRTKKARKKDRKSWNIPLNPPLVSAARKLQSILQHLPIETYDLSDDDRMKMAKGVEQNLLSAEEHDALEDIADKLAWPNSYRPRGEGMTIVHHVWFLLLMGMDEKDAIGKVADLYEKDDDTVREKWVLWKESLDEVQEFSG